MIPLVLLLAASIVADVRRAINAGDLAGAAAKVEAHRAANGITPEMLEAHSWLGRGALAKKDLDAAAKYAAETKRMALEALKQRKLDADRHLPIALGAAIEVEAQVLAARGDRSGAAEYLAGELEAYRGTSIETRIQKNLNLLSLEGKPAPAVAGAALPKGKPAILFFWAHWCPDCKNMAPALARLRKEFPDLAVLAPTQLYGYAERGREAGAEEETRYIESIRKQHYANLPGPVNAENFKRWGASTTPTVVLVDRSGVVRLYHPGQMTYEELKPRLEKIYGAVTSAPPRSRR